MTDAGDMSNDDRRDRLLRLVERLKKVEDPADVYDQLVEEFVRLAQYPGAADLVFHDDLPAHVIVERILAYEPIRLPGPPA